MAPSLGIAPDAYVIEAVELTGLGAQGFGRWLDQWHDLEAEGWDVTVLVPRGKHRQPRAIGLALSPALSSRHAPGNLRPVDQAAE